MRRWKISTKMIRGTVTTTDAALIVPSGISNCWLPVKKAIAAGTGRRSGVLVSVIAKRNSFQAKMKTSRPAVTTPGARERDHDLAERLAAASLRRPAAASSSSRGISRKNEARM